MELLLTIFIIEGIFTLIPMMVIIWLWMCDEIGHRSALSTTRTKKLKHGQKQTYASAPSNRGMKWGTSDRKLDWKE